MHAMSFLGTVGHVESQLGALGDRRLLDDERPIRNRVWRSFDGLADLVELVVVTFPLPPLSEHRPAAEDEAVRSVLGRTYEGDGLDRDDLDGRLLDADRVEVVGGEVLVPLAAHGPAAANWYVLYSWLGDRLDEVCGTCRRLAGRVDREGWPTWADALRGLQTVAADLRSVVGHAVAVTQWVAPPDGGIDDETRSLRRTAARLVNSISDEL